MGTEGGALGAALGEGDVGAIARLCARSLAAPPSAHELERSLFSPYQPATVRGDPDIGVVATVRGTGGEAGVDQGFIRLLVVDPSARGEGHGHTLLRRAEADLAGASSITVGADAPYFLFPGVETNEIEFLCLLERHHYERAESNFNMAVDLDAIPPDPGGTVAASDDDRAEIEAWMSEQYPHWREEVVRALEQGTLLLARDDAENGAGINGFCAWDVNRRGLLGPIAVRLDRIGTGIGVPLLLGGLHRLRARTEPDGDGRRLIDVVWVGPIVPYARVGGRVSKVFFVYRKRLA